MKVAQERELLDIHEDQKTRVADFARAWEHYMVDYEQIALDMIDKLKDRHENELKVRLHDLAQRFYQEHRWSKPIVL